MTYIALGFARSIKAVSWGWILMNVPFCKFMLRRIISDPSPTQRLFIIHTGIWHMPSSAENSRTPQNVFIPICELEIIKVIGYWIRSRLNSWSADVGRMTKQKTRIMSFILCMGDVSILTFVSSINFWLAYERRWVDFVAAKEHVGRVRYSSSNITINAARTSTVVSFIQTSTASSSEEVWELMTNIWLLKCNTVVYLPLYCLDYYY